MSRVTLSIIHTGLGLREGPTISRGPWPPRIWHKLLALYLPPPTFYSFFTCPLCFRDTTPLQKRTPRPIMEIPSIPPGNQELARAISRAGTPRLAEPASPSPTPRTTAPLEFLSDLFAETRDSLRLPPQLVQNLSPHALSTISAGEGSILSILCAAVLGIVTINKQLDTVNTRLVELCKENKQLREKIHDVSSVLANDVDTSEELRPLNSALRDLSHWVSAPPPPRQTPQAPPAQPANVAPARPPPRTKQNSLTSTP